MKFNRRAFVGFMGLAYSAAKAKTNESLSPSQYGKKYSVLQGATDSESAQFSVIQDKSERLIFELQDSRGNRINRIKEYDLRTQGFSNTAVARFTLENLEPNYGFFLNILDSNGNLLDRRSFKAIDTEKNSLNFSVLSCMNDYLYRDDVWRHHANAKSDIAFIVGDSCYADMVSLIERRDADPAQLWSRYAQTRLKLRHYFEDNLTPTIYVWDDHDMGKNNGDRNFRYKAEAKDIFNTFTAQSENKILTRGPGVSSALTLCGQSFLLLDNRTYRSAPGDKNPAYFGSVQKSWALDYLSQHQKPSWLMSGTQWFGGYRKKEGYEYAHYNLMKQFFVELKKLDLRTILVSGDIHMSEIMRVEPNWFGYPTYEITSSAMHSLAGPGWSDRLQNPRRISHVVASNFTQVLSSPNANRHDATIKCITNSGGTAYQQRLFV